MSLLRQRNNLRKVRHNLQLSGYDLQLLCGINVGRIYSIERGLCRPREYEKHLITEALKLSQEEIFPPDMVFSRKIVNTGRGENKNDGKKWVGYPSKPHQAEGGG